MKICDRHALRLREELEQRSLGHLINHDLEKQRQINARLMMAAPKGSEDFDPWLLAQIHLAQEFMASLNPPHLIHGMREDLCPLCAVAHTNTIIAESWIKGCCNGLLEQAWGLGLMVKPAGGTAQ